MSRLLEARAALLGAARTTRALAALGLIATLSASTAALLIAAAPAGAATVVSAYPIPGTKYNLPGNQISFRGIAPAQIGTVQVVGSSSGAHTGQLDPDSDGDGASFVPATPFQRGETVTVTTSLDIAGAPSGKFSFQIAQTAAPIKAMPLPVAPTGTNGLQHFQSRPDLLPPAVDISNDSAPASQGDIFVAPQYGPAQNGPMILDPRGRLIWFDPIPISQNTLVTDFRVQTMGGAPVLTWWQGYTNHGSGRGEGIILDTTYHQIGTVQAGNGLMMDLHEFLLEPPQTAWIIAVSPVWIKGIGKPVMDAVVQEIDIPTGLVLFEWHALDHVAMSDSYFTPKAAGFVYDPFHMNSVMPIPGGSVLVSMRNTSTVYKVNQSTGQILWELGGKHSTFKLGKGVSTAFQHDALVQPDGSITVFDDGAGPPALHPYSRGLRIKVDPRTKTATLADEYDHSPDISSDFEGNVQELGGGDVFMGWGQQPYFSEDDGNGHQIFDAHFVEPTSSYRAYRFAWSAQPTTSPSLAVSPASDGATNVYASWNGATAVSQWRVLSGATPSSLGEVSTVSDSAFETTVPVHTGLPSFQVQALGAAGQVLGSSDVAQAPPHLAIYGRTAFIDASGTGSVAAGCLAPQACSISTTISVGRTVIARTGREALSAGAGGLIFFRLSSSGLSMLGHAKGNRLVATVASRDASGMSVTSTLSFARFGTSGAGPKRTLTESATLQLIGATDFVSAKGTGGLLVACYTTTPCHVNATVNVGSTTIATGRNEFIGAEDLGYVIFALTPSGRSMLAHARGNQLGATVSVSGAGATASGQIALVRFS